MALRRSSLLLLGAVLALLGLPASALAQDVTPPDNLTPPTPGAWHTSPYVVKLEATDDLDPTPMMHYRLSPGGAVTIWEAVSVMP